MDILTNISAAEISLEVEFWNSSLQDRTEDHIHNMPEISGFQCYFFSFQKASLHIPQISTGTQHTALQGAKQLLSSVKAAGVKSTEN